MRIEQNNIRTVFDANPFSNTQAGDSNLLEVDLLATLGQNASVATSESENETESDSERENEEGDNYIDDVHLSAESIRECSFFGPHVIYMAAPIWLDLDLRESL